jgi:proline iminopeptidase
MPNLTANGISLHYESRGNEGDPAILMIMGLGVQMVLWPDALIDALVAQGFRVVRFDNRDVGLSTHLSHLGVPNVPMEFLRFKMRLPVRAQYTIDTMAQDTAALIEALELKQPHVVGASMGGMIGQSLAAYFPQHVSTLTSIMSTTGRRSLPQPGWRALKAVLAPAGRDVPSAIARMEHVLSTIGSLTYPAPREHLRAICERHVLRALDPAGSARQLVAIAASDDRSHTIARIKAPTLVMHGDEDPLVPVEAGHDTARVIRSGGGNAEVSIVRGMGHDFPIPLIPQIAGEIGAFCRRHTNAL